MMDNDNLRKIAVRSGSGAVVVGMLLFFFANDATASMPFDQRVIASLVGIVVSLVALRYFFARFKF